MGVLVMREDAFANTGMPKHWVRKRPLAKLKPVIIGAGLAAFAAIAAIGIAGFWSSPLSVASIAPVERDAIPPADTSQITASLEPLAGSAVVALEPAKITSTEPKPDVMADAQMPQAAPAPERFGSTNPVAPQPVTLPQTETETAANTAYSAPLETPVTREPVAIAETEDEVRALEEQLSASGSAYFQLPPREQRALDTPWTQPTPSGQTVDLPLAWTNKYVNLRAGEDNDAEVLAVIPANAQVRAQDNCAHWCRVVYEGRQGYVYKTFLSRAP